MSFEDDTFNLLNNRLAAMRKRRDTFERMGSDDAVRSMQNEIDLVSGIADELLMVSADRKSKPSTKEAEK